MEATARRRYTQQEYLDLERAAERRSEYVNGEIYAMAGTTREHILIVGNLVRDLITQLRNRPCETYATDLRLKVSETGMYTYPDVAVACGEIKFEDQQFDTLLKPVLIIEVLSPTTEAYDRGDKFDHYRHIDSLKEYVLIAQDQPRIERLERQPDDSWLLIEPGQSDETVHLSSIDCVLEFSSVYHRVRFGEER